MKKSIIIVITFSVLVLLGIGGYFLYLKFVLNPNSSSILIYESSSSAAWGGSYRVVCRNGKIAVSRKDSKYYVIDTLTASELTSIHNILGVTSFYHTIFSGSSRNPDSQTSYFFGYVGDDKIQTAKLTKMLNNTDLTAIFQTDGTSTYNKFVALASNIKDKISANTVVDGNNNTNEDLQTIDQICE